MLKGWQIAVLVFLAIAVALFAGSFLFSPEYQICGPNEYTHAIECTQHHLGPFVVLWIIALIDGHNGLVTAIATIFIAGFTWTLRNSSIVQGRLTEVSIEQSERSSRTGLRAYVFPQAIEAKNFRVGDSAFTTVSLVWKNMGQTPMRHGETWICWKAFPGGIPKDFGFPKKDFKSTSQIAIGPGQEVVSQTNIGFGYIRDAYNGTAPLYVYGAVEYNDAFRRTKRRKTEFCCAVKVLTEPTLGGECEFAFEHHSQHNGADNDCYRPPEPYSANPVA